MELQPRGYERVVQLIDKGATIPNPSSLHIGDEVDLSRVSTKGLTIYPGCRLYGEKTVISPGAVLGAEGPVTIEDCALGPNVELKGGYFKQSVFLEKASLGLGAEVREGCLLEEAASGAHAVGLKQTILFPFVTLGSLVNFCDCLLGGGTGSSDHSEVGSSYVHFNFTPDGDKATASLFGDVPRGVMLNQPPIFLGGQGGAVGPLWVNFGTVVAAGSILREDVGEVGQLIIAPSPRGLKRGHVPFAYKNLSRVVRTNVAYLANLVVLEAWYRAARQSFFARQEMGGLVYTAALEVLSLAIGERTKRLQALVDRAIEAGAADRTLSGRVSEACAIFGESQSSEMGAEGEGFLTGLLTAASVESGDYLDAIRSLAPDLAAQGSVWLQGVVDGLYQRAEAVLRLDDKGRPAPEAAV
jgi:bifunctional UDP-N-acetylglucosamine pyrophosphorylase/glucosamine-1-phosphate N-acetyltransferase